MRIKISRVVFFLLITSSLLPAQQKVREKDLMQRYRDWLQQTKYIMYSEEKEVFLQLSDIRERDIFIETLKKNIQLVELQVKEEQVLVYYFAKSLWRKNGGKTKTTSRVLSLTNSPPPWKRAAPLIAVCVPSTNNTPVSALSR